MLIHLFTAYHILFYDYEMWFSRHR